MVRVNRFLVDTIVACEGDRFLGDPPWGIFGGHAGPDARRCARTRGSRTRRAGRRSSPTSALKAGDTIEITVPNSGGYGDPVERDPELVLSDVLDGFTSLEQALEIYRVAIDPETLVLDLESTDRLRSRSEEMAGQVFGSDAP